MKIWIDDVIPAPEEYVWLKCVNDAIRYIETYGDYEDDNNTLVVLIEIIDIGYDAGQYAQYGGDYIKLLEWFEETGRNYPIRIHSMNSVGVANMRAIIQKNGWEEVK